MADRAPNRVLIADDEDMVRTGFYGALHGGASGFLLKDSGPAMAAAGVSRGPAPVRGRTASRSGTRPAGSPSAA